MQTKTISVSLEFNGTVTVKVPARLFDKDAQILGEAFALSRILATTDNPDAPDEDACVFFVDRCSDGTEDDWDASECIGVNGTFAVKESSITK